MVNFLLTIPPDSVRDAAAQQLPHDAVTAVELSNVPLLPQLKAAVGGGLIEVVPQFYNIMWAGQNRHCVAFCDEEGKLRNLPLNTHATVLWYLSLQFQGVDSCRDQLFGPVAVVTGDLDFLRRL